MALFSRAAPLDPQLESITIGFQDNYRASSLKHLAKHQEGVKASLRPDETICLVAIHSAGLRTHFVVVTSQRVMEFIGPSPYKQCDYSNIAGVATFQEDSSSLMFVQIETQTARLDYRPDDPDRFKHIILAPAATPRQQNQIVDAIKRIR